MSSYLARMALGDTQYLAIPVFLSRTFRHSAIYVYAESGIKSPEDLKGRCVGVPEYAMTAALWVRGLLDDDFGIKPQDLHWRTGGLHQTGRKPKAEIKLPPSIDILPINADETLDGLLADGKIPALISARPPQIYRSRTGPVRRLFPNHRALERDYYIRTQIFPIMHVVGIRSDFVHAHPWLASSVFKAFREAKDLAIAELEDCAAPQPSHCPWFDATLNETLSTMGSDFWPYGLEPNRTTIDAMLRYAHRQSTTPRLLDAEEIFVASTLEVSKQ